MSAPCQSFSQSSQAPRQNRTDKHNNLFIIATLLPLKTGTTAPHREGRLLSWGRCGARASKNATKLAYHFTVAVFLIQLSLGCCKPLAIFQSSDKVGSDSFTCFQCFCGGMGARSCLHHFLIWPLIYFYNLFMSP